jgi:hypothetical protein
VSGVRVGWVAGRGGAGVVAPAAGGWVGMAAWPLVG